jgi:hypothetical protein
MSDSPSLATPANIIQSQAIRVLTIKTPLADGDSFHLITLVSTEFEMATTQRAKPVANLRIKLSADHFI